MPRFCIKISDTVVFGVPRSACTSRTVSRWNSLIATGTRSIFSGSLLVAGLPECESLPTDSQPFLKHFCHTFICATLIALSPKAFWIIWTVTAEECSNLMQNWMHFHCSTCSVILNAMATQYTCSLNGVYRSRWLVQWSHHCSLPLAARLCQCHTNHSHYINNGLTFSGQTSYLPKWSLNKD